MRRVLSILQPAGRAGPRNADKFYVVLWKESKAFIGTCVSKTVGRKCLKYMKQMMRVGDGQMTVLHSGKSLYSFSPTKTIPTPTSTSASTGTSERLLSSVAL